MLRVWQWTTQATSLPAGAHILIGGRAGNHIGKQILGELVMSAVQEGHAGWWCLRVIRGVWECLTSRGTFEPRPHSEQPLPPPPGPPWPPGRVWPLPTTLCFTTLLQAHWPSCCSSNLPSSFLPQNLFAFRSFCPETSSSRSPCGSRPHLIQVSAPMSAPQGGAARPPTTPRPTHCSAPALPRSPGVQRDVIVLSLTRKLHKDRDFSLFIATSQHSRQWRLVRVFWVLVLMVMIVTFSFLNYSFLGSAVGMSPLCNSNWAKQIGLVVKGVLMCLICLS